jgi:tripartite-type tricarboxylate transporter receptor subunit TctC
MIAKTFVTNVSLFKNVPYDPVKSFTPIIKLATGSIVLAVHPSVPADNVAAFIRYVKVRPGEVNYGSPGFATPHHLAMELFKHATGTDLVHIPYKGFQRLNGAPLASTDLTETLVASAHPRYLAQ